MLGTGLAMRPYSNHVALLHAHIRTVGSGGRPHHLCYKGFDASFGRIELRGSFENVG